MWLLPSPQSWVPAGCLMANCSSPSSHEAGDLLPPSSLYSQNYRPLPPPLSVGSARLFQSRSTVKFS